VLPFVHGIGPVTAQTPRLAPRRAAGFLTSLSLRLGVLYSNLNRRKTPANEG